MSQFGIPIDKRLCEKWPYRMDLDFVQTFSGLSPLRSFCLSNFLSGSTPVNCPSGVDWRHVFSFEVRDCGEKRLEAKENSFLIPTFLNDGFGVLRENKKKFFFIFFSGGEGK